MCCTSYQSQMKNFYRRLRWSPCIHLKDLYSDPQVSDNVCCISLSPSQYLRRGSDWSLTVYVCFDNTHRTLTELRAWGEVTPDMQYQNSATDPMLGYHDCPAFIDLIVSVSSTSISPCTLHVLLHSIDLFTGSQSFPLWSVSLLDILRYSREK